MAPPRARADATISSSSGTWADGRGPGERVAEDAVDRKEVLANADCSLMESMTTGSTSIAIAARSRTNRLCQRCEHVAAMHIRKQICPTNRMAMGQKVSEVRKGK